MKVRQLRHRAKPLQVLMQLERSGRFRSEVVFRVRKGYAEFIGFNWR